MKKATKVFIVEGENRELRFFNQIKKLFMNAFDDSIIINVPAAGNIYMLYEILKEDDFETDVIEVIREKIDSAGKLLENVSRADVTEVYLFFDADLHSNNFAGNRRPEELLFQMLSTFDNETENGKLYISYPMIEALYDIWEGECRAFSKCWVSVGEFSGYKGLAGGGNELASRHFSSETEWKKVIQAFYLRTKCLFGLHDLTFHMYKALISPLSVWQKQNRWIAERESVFVLSALPELLLDYFREDFWDGYIDESESAKGECEEQYRSAK